MLDVNPVSTEPFLNDFNESNETLKTDFALNLKNLANEIIGNNEINNDTSNDIPTTKSKYNIIYLTIILNLSKLTYTFNI